MTDDISRFRKNVKKIVCRPVAPSSCRTPSLTMTYSTSCTRLGLPEASARALAARSNAHAITVFMPLFLPLVSSKAYAKIQYTRSLRSLYRVHGVSLAGIKLSIPLLHTEANAIQESHGTSTRGSRPPSMIDGITSMLGKVLGAVPFLPKWDEEAESDRLDRDGRALLGSLDEFISSEPAPIPRILLELREVILSEPCNKTEGIFRRSSNVSLRQGPNAERRSSPRCPAYYRSYLHSRMKSDPSSRGRCSLSTTRSYRP